MRKADHQLVQNVLDGNVTREEFDAFQQRLRSEPELTKLYKEYSLLHHTLHEEFEGTPIGETTTGTGTRLTRHSVLLLTLIFVCIIASFLFLTNTWNPQPQIGNAALVTFSLDAVWRIDGPSRSVGSATGVPAGAVIHLLQGRAGVHLEPSIIAHIEGPSEATLTSPGVLHLASGTMFLDAGETLETLRISTPQCNLTSHGAHFGIIANPAGTTEVHVLRGNVRIESGGSTNSISAGNAVRITGSAPAVSIPQDEHAFPRTLGRYRPVPIKVFDRKQWRIEYGNPTFSNDRIEGSNYSIYQEIPDPGEGTADGVLLVTIEVGKPVTGAFHTDGWAGVSLYRNGEELVFFGDSYGSTAVWSLDVKQRTPTIPAEQPVSGPKNITLRYHSHTGEVTLHEGGFPLKPSFCKGRIQPGIRFDQIRVAASTGAALTVNALSLRIGGE